jgi:hypothetical protein
MQYALNAPRGPRDGPNALPPSRPARHVGAWTPRAISARGAPRKGSPSSPSTTSPGFAPIASSLSSASAIAGPAERFIGRDDASGGVSERRRRKKVLSDR